MATIGYKKCLDETKTKFVLVEIEIPEGVKYMTPEWAHEVSPYTEMLLGFLNSKEGQKYKARMEERRRNNPPKSRAEKAKVLKVHGSSKVAYSLHSNAFEYKVGEEVIPDGFGLEEIACSHGIHFFLSKEDAIKYATGDRMYLGDDKILTITDAIVDEEQKEKEIN